MNGFLASPWIPTVAMMLLAIGARVLSGSWLAPGSFALSVWSLYLIVPLTVAREYKVPAIGVWLILLFVLCIAIGAELGVGRNNINRSTHSREFSYSRQILYLSLFLTLPVLLGTLYWSAKTIEENGLDLSVAGLLALGHVSSVVRYAGEQPPLLARLLVVWAYPAALLGGMSYAANRRYRDKLICFLPILVSLLLSLLQAAKANTLIGIALALSGFWGMKVFISGGAYRPLSRKALLILTALVTIGLLFFLATDTLRTHKQEEDIAVDADWGRVKVSTLGYLAVFSQWTNGPSSAFQLNLGAYTFGGVLELVGLRSRQIGIYTQSVDFEGAAESNIFTAFRGLIEDFSLFGATIVCFLGGFFSGRAFLESRAGRETGIVALAGFFAFLIWSPLGSLFVYNGPILAIVVGIFVLRKCQNATRVRITSASLAS
jgi:oligosaccharide repeat unit polymerase